MLAATAAAGALLPWRKAAAKKGNKCQKQLKPCLDTVDMFCSRVMLEKAAAAPAEPDPACVANLAPCCDPISQCQLGQTLHCLDNKMRATK